MASPTPASSSATAAPQKQYPAVVLVCKNDQKVNVSGPIVGKLTTIVDMLGDALCHSSTTQAFEIPCSQHSASVVSEIIQYYESHMTNSEENFHTYVKEETTLLDEDKKFCNFDDLVKCLATAFWFHKEDLTYEPEPTQDMDVDNESVDNKSEAKVEKKQEVVVQDPSEPEITPELAEKRRQLLAEDDDWADEQDTRYRCNIGHKRPLPAVGTELYVKVAPHENQNDWFPRKRFYDTFIPEKYGHINPVLYRVVERGSAFGLSVVSTTNGDASTTPTQASEQQEREAFYSGLAQAGFVVAHPVEPGAGPECYLGKFGYAWSVKQDDIKLLPTCHMARCRIIDLILTADFLNANAMYNVLTKCMALTTTFYGDKFTPQMFRAMWLLYHDLKGDEHMKQWKWNEAESKLERIDQ